MFNWQYGNIGSGKGYVLAGDKPSSYTILTQIYVTIMSSLGHHDLTQASGHIYASVDWVR